MNRCICSVRAVCTRSNSLMMKRDSETRDRATRVNMRMMTSLLRIRLILGKKKVLITLRMIDRQSIVPKMKVAGWN